MSIESQSQEGPKIPDFVFTISPKTENFLKSLDIFIDGANIMYLKNNIKIPIMYIPEMSEGFSDVKLEQVGETNNLKVDYNNGNGPISKIVDLDAVLRELQKTNK